MRSYKSWQNVEAVCDSIMDCCVGETEQIKDTFHNQFVSLKKVEQQSCKVSIYQSQYAGSCSHIKEWTGFEDDTFCEACTTRHALQTRNCYKIHM